LVEGAAIFLLLFFFLPDCLLLLLLVLVGDGLNDGAQLDRSLTALPYCLCPFLIG